MATPSRTTTPPPVSSTPAPPETGRRRGAVPAAVIGVGLVSLAVLWLALGSSGATRARDVLDPGILVRWGLPTATTVHHLAMSITWAGLVFATTVVPRSIPATGAGRPRVEHPAFARAMTVTAAAAAVWTLAAVAIIVLSYADTIGTPVSGSPEFTGQLGYYVTRLIPGQAWAVTAVMAALTTTLAVLARSPQLVAATTVVALAAVVPLSQLGHVAGVDDHNGAVNALALHLLGAGIWTGGIIVLALLTPLLTTRHAGQQSTHRVLVRFSALAGAAFVLVTVSGVINTVYRIGGWDGLDSGYGALVIAKTIATLALGVLGYLNRRAITARPPALGRVWRLITVEALILCAVMALGVALGRTPTPVPREREPDITDAEILTGYLLPPPLSATEWFTQWRFDWLWIAVAILAAVLYLAGVRRLHRAGTPWPAARTVAFLAGLVLLVYVTCGAMAIYAPILFSIHTTAHLLLAFPVPLLLIAGAPGRLAAALVPARTDGSTGWRELTTRWRTSRAGVLLARPVPAAILVLAGLGVSYYTPVFALALHTHVGHELMNTTAIALGLIFAATVLSPPRDRAAVHTRALTLVAVPGALGAWAAAIALSPMMVQPEWFSGLGRDWGPSPLADQQSAASSILLTGALPLLAAALAVLARGHHPATPDIDNGIVKDTHHG
ncbi:copper resistance protein CopD [Kocuria sediminis]|uniref:Copper resistance protein CopD n=1 Tax=Kocuria sediminis TaxID=1038857 RepID=A0A6N8GQY7_9MICC|nr:cytochrome c oxidase assembly protein [Kocuria sediminis]MUN64690.1 copper resistance protein CopD [Kocuria sediminis]